MRIKWSISMLLIPFLAALGTANKRSGPPQAPPFGGLLENVGQFDPAYRYRIAVDNAVVHLGDDAVWIAQPDGPGSGRWKQFQLDFGQALAWEPFGRLGTKVRYITGGEGGMRVRQPALWSGARARLGGGAEVEITSTGIMIRGNGVGAVELALRGGEAALDGRGVRVDGSLLPVAWSADLRVNGRAAGNRGGLTGFGSPPAQGTQLFIGSFLGGESWDEAAAVVWDEVGSLYMAGHTQSEEFPALAGGFEAGLHAVDAFAAGFNWNGTALDYITVFAGDDEDFASGLALDPEGNLFVAGRTDSGDFPTTPGAFDTTPNGSFDAFLVKLDPGGAVVFSTLLGGSEAEIVTGMEAGPDGSAYLTGSTFSDGAVPPAFPTTADAYRAESAGSRDAFLARLSADGSGLLYGTFLGGSAADQGEGLALRGSAVLIAGWTGSNDFDPSPAGFDHTLDGIFDAFVLALVPGAQQLDFWTYLGGNDGPSITGERALSLSLGRAGEIFVGGSTVAADFPATAGAFDPIYGGGSCDGFPCSDGFAAMLSPDGGSLLWASFLGASGEDDVRAVLYIPGTGLYLAGETGSADFPVTPDGFDSGLDGLSDGFLVRLTPDGDALAYGSFLGGSAGDGANAVSASESGRIAIAGWSESADFPTSPGAFDPGHNGDKDATLTVLVPPGVRAIRSLYFPLVGSR